MTVKDKDIQVPSNVNLLNEDDHLFDCNICLDNVKDPVVSLCGHLFCWSCLHEWLDIKGSCPVCKSVVDLEKVVPVYGRGVAISSKDKEKLPPRPCGQRVEEPPNSWIGISFGLSAFLIIIFMSTFNIGSHRSLDFSENEQFAVERVLSKIFWLLAIIIVVLLLMS